MGAHEQRADIGPLVLKSPTLGGESTSPRTVYSERLRADILTLRKRGLVPLAIADILDVSDGTVSNHIRALVKVGELIPTPRYLEQTGPEREIQNCPHCGKVL